MAAESRIRDVDMASEMTNFTKLQILQQSGTAMLAQANMSQPGRAQPAAVAAASTELTARPMPPIAPVEWCTSGTLPAGVLRDPGCCVFRARALSSCARARPSPQPLRRSRATAAMRGELWRAPPRRATRPCPEGSRRRDPGELGISEPAACAPCRLAHADAREVGEDHPEERDVRGLEYRPSTIPTLAIAATPRSQPRSRDRPACGTRCACTVGTLVADRCQHRAVHADRPLAVNAAQRGLTVGVAVAGPGVEVVDFVDRVRRVWRRSRGGIHVANATGGGTARRTDHVISCRVSLFRCTCACLG